MSMIERRFYASARFMLFDERRKRIDAIRVRKTPRVGQRSSREKCRDKFRNAATNSGRVFNMFAVPASTKVPTRRVDGWRRLIPAISIIGCLAIAPVASAHIVQMNFFTGQWMNVSGGTSIVNTGTGNNAQVHWGGDQGSGQSGYVLDLAPPPPVPIVQNVPPNTSPFFIGNFTHENQPIASGTSITGVDLRINFDIIIDGTDIGFHDFFFHFAHDETPNGDNPCAYGGNNGQGVNINGCADRVLISFLNTSSTFLVDGVSYTFNLLGFSTNGGQTISSQFLTVEQQNNTAALYATIQTRESVNQAPEPASMLLLAAGVVGMTLVRRRAS
jgi:hypothetical protein